MICANEKVADPWVRTAGFLLAAATPRVVWEPSETSFTYNTYVYISPPLWVVLRNDLYVFFRSFYVWSFKVYEIIVHRFVLLVFFKKRFSSVLCNGQTKSIAVITYSRFRSARTFVSLTFFFLQYSWASRFFLLLYKR